jgi:hypothetical protein
MHEDAAYDLEYRSYPVAEISEGVTDLLSGDYDEDRRTLEAMLIAAKVSNRPPPGWNYESKLAGQRVCIDRIHPRRGGREQTAWSIHLPGEG